MASFLLLLQDYFTPGVYELGFVRKGDASRKGEGEDVFAFYVGQAENVWERLRQYNKDGSHLGMIFTRAASKTFQWLSALARYG